MIRAVDYLGKVHYITDEGFKNWEKWERLFGEMRMAPLATKQGKPLVRGTGKNRMLAMIHPARIIGIYMPGEKIDKEETRMMVKWHKGRINESIRKLTGEKVQA